MEGEPSSNSQQGPSASAHQEQQPPTTQLAGSASDAAAQARWQEWMAAQDASGEAEESSLGGYENIDELAATAPVENVRDSQIYRHKSLEDTRSVEQQRRQSLALIEQQQGGAAAQGDVEEVAKKDRESSHLVTQAYTLSYLVFFAILGTLARIGLASLTTYPGAPVIFGTLWANFAGSLVMGFLIEDRMLFSIGVDHKKQRLSSTHEKKADEVNGSSADDITAESKAAEKKKHLALKKTIPLYVGLATGFCGSLTSFSSFIKDSFLALSNEMTTPAVTDSPMPRNGGYSFMALLAVIILTISLSMSALFIGAHLAIALEHVTRPVNFPALRRVTDPLVIVLGWGSWIGAIFLAIFPPHTDWRGRAVFSLVFAPLGCLARFYLALLLNSKVPSFPLGTFAANIAGTAVLGMAWDIAHASVGGVVGCQVLQGVEDGFCGCLTTISTWVSELSSLRRRHSYIYGGASLVTALVVMIAIMGGLRWSEGFSPLLCST